jgi:hypothetical protein
LLLNGATCDSHYLAGKLTTTIQPILCNSTQNL